MTNARVKIVNVRPKGNVRLLPTSTDKDRIYIERAIRRVLDLQGDMAGFAIVVWGPDGSSSCDMASGPRSHIPSVVIPDLVRNRLLAYRIGTWTLEDVFPGYIAP